MRGFWISPARYPDFAWAWLTRLLVNIGNHMVTLYLLFFLNDAVRVRETQGIEPEFGVLILTGLYAVMVIITSVIGGRLSDRLGRRKPLVIISSAVIAAASLILAFAPTWPGALIGASVLGIGFGCYLAVDFALITQVLPTALNRGKDLGVINIANSLPQVLAPLIAYPVCGPLGRLRCAVRGGRRDRASRRRVRGEDQGRGLSRRRPVQGLRRPRSTRRTPGFVAYSGRQLPRQRGGRIAPGCREKRPPERC